MRKLIIILISLLLMVAGATSTFARHFKKDGSPDRRYKENKSYYSSPTFLLTIQLDIEHRLLLFKEIPEAE